MPICDYRRNNIIVSIIANIWQIGTSEKSEAGMAPGEQHGIRHSFFPHAPFLKAKILSKSLRYIDLHAVKATILRCASLSIVGIAQDREIVAQYLWRVSGTPFS